MLKKYILIYYKEIFIFFLFINYIIIVILYVNIIISIYIIFVDKLYFTRRIKKHFFNLFLSSFGLYYIIKLSLNNILLISFHI